MTKDDLLKELERDGIDLGSNPSRRISEYIHMGLIKKPIRYGLGKGKGTAVDFEDKAAREIKNIIAWHKEGLTYEEIKYKKMGVDDWLSLFGQLKKSSKTEHDSLESIRKLPFLSDSEKGRLKLVSDLADYLSRIVVEGAKDFLGSDLDDRYDEYLTKDIKTDMEGFILGSVLYYLDAEGEDYEAYLEGRKPEWRPLSQSKRGFGEMLAGWLKEDKKNKEGGT